VVIAVALALAVAWRAAPARADGDPASDVLASQSLFVPADAGIPLAQRERLAALLRSARDSGYQIRVALIAAPSDLGSITALWRQPGNYARFLGQELSQLYRGPVLVVMPNGFGAYGAGRSGRGTAGLPAPGSGSRLATAALTAIARMAAVAGRRLSVPRVSSPARGDGGAGIDIAAWAVFAVGLALIASAWALSLRSRPLRGAHRSD
jgi:hypothetical protein